MNKIEVSGRTIEEAIQIAAMELGVGTDAVEYEIVEEGAKGFLGLGTSPTLIKAWVVEGYVAPKVAPEPAPIVEEEVAEEQPEVPGQPKPVMPGTDIGQFKNALNAMLEDVLKAMDITGTVNVRAGEGDEILADMDGKDVGILIGRHGQTLDALQYLISIAANRSQGTHYRVVLDAEGYRRRYEEVLVRKAHEYAEAVKAEGQECELEPQPPRDRRIVHMALAYDPDVYTYSEGEGDNRHVVISPKK
jgi:spoIIIJ-associated protein